jgi:hypothetical protein
MHSFCLLPPRMNSGAFCYTLPLIAQTPIISTHIPKAIAVFV